MIWLTTTVCCKDLGEERWGSKLNQPQGKIPLARDTFETAIVYH